MQKSAYLILENGTVFKGKSFGYEGETIGEVVFTTATTGYIETLTDPGYYGQFVTHTFPLIGNYGMISSDVESEKPQLKAYIVRDWCRQPSNFRCEGLIDTFLKQNKIIGLYGIDTRELTKIVREHGVMNAKITTSDAVTDELMEQIKSYKIVDAIENVTCKEEKVYTPEEKKYRVVLWDFGAKNSIIKNLTDRGCEVVRVPASTSAKRIFELEPDGVLLSNGPADPAQNMDIVSEVKKVLDKKIPAFGIDMGHLLMALSQGFKTYKLKSGHRGANQPSLNTKTGGVYITSQNHSYAVSTDSIGKNARESYKNVNDGSCEGIEYLDMPAFSSQFFPCESGGPLNAAVMYDEFVEMMAKGGRK